jgi:hypothetical protein
VFESEGVRKEYEGIEAAGSPLKSRVAGDLHHHNPEIDTSTGVLIGVEGKISNRGKRW